MQFFQTPNIDFIVKRKIAFVLSSILLLIGMISLIIHGGPNYGIDFKGGTSIVIKFDGQVSIPQIRDALTSVELGKSEIKRFGTTNEFLIYVAQHKSLSAVEMARKVELTVGKSIKNAKYEIEKIDVIGPRIGEELRKAAALAIFIALILILIYVGWRFEVVFATGAIIALFHDVLITLGAFSILNFEISLKEIAAFLTIVGYSLNDTIVVYDRIRENLKVLRSDNLEAIINKSINQVLSRTIITSLTTFTVVLILFLFGGKVLHGFAFAMLLGVIVGTYSSIFVASPIVYEWQMRHGGKRALKMAKKKRG
ncbi:protein translocase subunit SecF [bacterium]|nr:protein translocase subunit SecF [bacterium]